MFFNKHMNIETINGGKKSEKILFQNPTISREKTIEKNSLEKVRKQVFYENTNIVTKKWGGENARKFFSRNTSISRIINDEKNRLEKVRKHVFYKHTNIVIKKRGEEIARKKFSKNTRIGFPKIVGKK